MKRRVLALAAGELLLVVGGLWLVGHRPLAAITPTPALLFGYTLVVVALVSLPRMYVEFRRHGVLLTPADVAMLVGLFAVGPWFFIGAGMLAEIVASFKHRQTALKTAFNFVHMLGGLVAAATTFAVFGRIDPLDPQAWLAGAAAIAACALWDLLSTAAVLAIVEGQPFRSIVVRLAPAAAVGLVISSMLGTAVLVLFSQSPFGPLLFVPVLGIVLVSTRGVAHQRAERLHIERLYAASSNLTQLVGLPDMLGMIATEARTLVTGASALCCSLGRDGNWVGVIVDDRGSREAPAAMVAAVTDLARGKQGELASSDIDRRVRQQLPPFLSMVWAAKRGAAASAVVLAVFRELPHDEQEAHRSDILTAFVAHAAAVVANVGLHEDVQESLERQVALNRQKGEFVAAVSHELRTPLAAMMGSVQTIKRLADRLPAQERERLLDMGMSQGVRLKSLIEDLLLIAAADHEDIKVARDAIPMQSLFAALQQELSPLVGARLDVAVPSPAAVVLGDEEKVRRILVNLIDNAHKYAPEGPIEVTAQLSGELVSIAVSDHGPGIAEQDRERVFERFVQLDQSSTRRQGGTGLGLSLCRELAERLGGTLDLSESASGGARFELCLPAATAALATDTPGVEETALPRGMARSPLRRPPTPTPATTSDRSGGIAMKRPAAMARPASVAADDDGEPAIFATVAKGHAG